MKERGGFKKLTAPLTVLVAFIVVAVVMWRWLVDLAY